MTGEVDPDCKLFPDYVLFLIMIIDLLVPLSGSPISTVLLVNQSQCCPPPSHAGDGLGLGLGQRRSHDIHSEMSVCPVQFPTDEGWSWGFTHLYRIPRPTWSAAQLTSQPPTASGPLSRLSIWQVEGKQAPSPFVPPLLHVHQCFLSYPSATLTFIYFCKGDFSFP